jgi:multidrug efflux pump subunit AcrA (membrane-fusion protein)
MKKSKLWIPVTAIILSLAVIAGILIVPRLPKEEVAVFPVNMVGYTDYYSGSSESYGMVTTDKVQPLYLSGTQTVTEILVYPGQSVKKGDALFTYDTTLSDLAIERKDLANQQLEVELKTANAELAALKKMKPIVYKPGSSSSSYAKIDYTKSPKDSKHLNTVYSTKTTGNSASSPLYFWLKNGTTVDEGLIGEIFAHAEQQAKVSMATVYVVFQSTSLNRTDSEFNVQTGVRFSKTYAPIPTIPPTEGTEPTGTTTPSESTEPTESTAPSESTEPSTETTAPTEATEPSTETTAPTEPTETTAPSDPTGDAEGSTPTQSAQEPAPAQNREFSGYAMTFFTPPSAPSEDSGTVQWNDGYTSAELTAMKNEKQAEIKEIQFQIKIGKSELNIMKKEASDGKVTAAFDCVVSDILEPAAALETGEPLMKVTGGGGYYVEGTVSELALETIQIGQTVTVNSWDTGAVYDGTIVEVGSYPVEDQGYGTQNSSFYPYRVFIDESADLQEGFYVSMTYQTAEQAAGTLYLQNAFLRSEGNRSYVYVRNTDGVLEKRYLECGVSTDGYMTPILSGITEEDFVAFPYGKQIVEGAPTYEGTDQDLYGY